MVERLSGGTPGMEDYTRELKKQSARNEISENRAFPNGEENISDETRTRQSAEDELNLMRERLYSEDAIMDSPNSALAKGNGPTGAQIYDAVQHRKPSSEEFDELRKKIEAGEFDNKNEGDV